MALYFTSALALSLVALSLAFASNGITNNHKDRKVKLRIGLLLPDSSPPLWAEQRLRWVEHFSARMAHDDANVVIVPVVAYFSHNDTFLTTKETCRLVSSGVSVVYGADLGPLAPHVASVLSFFLVPFVQANPSLAWLQQPQHHAPAINVFPHRNSLTTMLLEVLHAQDDLGTVVVFYYDDSEILLWKTMQDSELARAHPQFVRVHREAADFEIMTLLLRLKRHSSVCAIHVEYTDSALAERFLRLCQLAGILNQQNSFVLTALDISEEALQPYIHLGANITLFRPSNMDIQSGRKLWELLLEDSLRLVTSSARLEWLLSFPTNLSCSASHSWPQGAHFLQAIIQSTFLGASGLLRLDADGERRDVSMDVLRLSEAGLRLVGVWTTRDGLMRKEDAEAGEHVLDPDYSHDHNHGYGIENGVETGHKSYAGKKTLVISSILSPPYTMEKLDAKERGRSGNDRYEGFAIDLADAIARIVGFNYSLAVTTGYGSIDPNTGQWNGMIKELLEERADMAIADLTINYDRERVVDFTMPFLDLGISLLYVKTPEKSVNFFSFLSPLSLEVWLLVILAGFFVSLVMLIIARLSPYETAELDKGEGVTPFWHFRHCLWFTVASWVQQGCDFLPRAVSARIVASFWWFFTLIIISSYTANLAAFLTIERMDAPIESAADLAHQTKIEYGSVSSGSTAAFFRDSKDETFAKMWRVMSRLRDEVMVSSTGDGVAKVLAANGAYAFFMESVSIEYQVERNCKLQQVGGTLDSKSYGIALQKGSSLRSAISSAIIKLNEEGKILEFKQKWWKKERGGGACKEEDKSASVSELSLKNVGGIFLVLAAGLVLGAAIAVAEALWTKCTRSCRKQR